MIISLAESTVKSADVFFLSEQKLSPEGTEWTETEEEAGTWESVWDLSSFFVLKMTETQLGS